MWRDMRDCETSRTSISSQTHNSSAAWRIFRARRRVASLKAFYTSWSGSSRIAPPFSQDQICLCAHMRDLTSVKHKDQPQIRSEVHACIIQLLL